MKISNDDQAPKTSLIKKVKTTTHRNARSERTTNLKLSRPKPPIKSPKFPELDKRNRKGPT